MPPLTSLPPDPPSGDFVGPAASVHLIHVRGRGDRDPVQQLLLEHEIPTSAEEHGYCGDNARFVEDQLDHTRSVYFYAGRAHPDYGSMALAFPASSERNRFHAATPFDSGGLVKHEAELHTAFRLLLVPDDTLTARVAYCRASVVSSPDTWRRELGRWFAYYYPSGAHGYWTDRPRPDPEELYSSNGDEWRAWTWEVRFRRGPNVVREAEAWTADMGYINELEDELN
jgi:hypothetical protein